MKSQDPYRIKIENGKISISIFQRGNPIPHTKYKGTIDNPKTKRFIENVIYKFSDRNAIDFLSFFISNSKQFKKRMTGDFNKLSQEIKFNGKKK